MTIDVNKLSTQELKALAFDTIVEKDRIIRNLDIINTELNKRAKETPKDEPKPEKSACEK